MRFDYKSTIYPVEEICMICTRCSSYPARNTVRCSKTFYNIHGQTRGRSSSASCIQSLLCVTAWHSPEPRSKGSQYKHHAALLTSYQYETIFIQAPAQSLTPSLCRAHAARCRQQPDASVLRLHNDASGKQQHNADCAQYHSRSGDLWLQSATPQTTRTSPNPITAIIFPSLTTGN
jgi:hypothetical protein